MRWWQRAVRGAAAWVLRLARVEAVDPGREADGLTRLGSAGTELDKLWEELSQEFSDAREVWRRNPMARRLVSLVTSFVCGDGIALTADEPHLAEFLTAFWSHEQNHLALRQYELCDELTRSGELFVTLHMNPADGMSYVRALPASSVDRVECAAGDYETELAYHEMVGPADPDYPGGRRWLAAGHPDVDAPEEDGAQADRPKPVCLHFAVNRPVGCVRGESDLASILPWLRRYSRWLEDRLRLSAGVHAFLWLVKVPGALLPRRRAELSHAPESGTLLVIDRDNEQWEALAPNLHAADAAADGRALRWMIVAGGPGVGLVDMGEGEEANLATARAMAEQRSRFMRARQQHFGAMLAEIALTAYNRAVRLGKVRGAVATLRDVHLSLPDISPSDNSDLGGGAAQIASALQSVAGQGVGGEAWRRLVVRTVLKFAGESIGEEELAEMVAQGATD